MDYLRIVIKLLIGLTMLLIIFRLIGNKQLSQVGPRDMIYVVIFANAIAQITFPPHLNEFHLIFSIIIWTIIIYIIDYITFRSEKAEQRIDGKPKLIIKDGEVLEDVLHEERLSMTELKTLLRNEGIWSIEEVEIAVLEISGKINCKKHQNR